MTTTRPMVFSGGVGSATQPGSSRDAAAAAPELFRNSRRLMRPMARLPAPGGQIRGDRLDLLVGIAFGDLMHHRCGPLARLELLHEAHELGAVSPRQARNSAPAHAVGAMAVGAGCGKIAP